MDLNNHMFRDVRDNILIHQLDPLSKLCLDIALTGNNYILNILHILWLGKYKWLYPYFKDYECEFPFKGILNHKTYINNHKLLIKDIQAFVLSLYDPDLYTPVLVRGRQCPKDNYANYGVYPRIYGFGNIKRGKNKYDNRLRAMAYAASGYDYSLKINPFNNLDKTSYFRSALLLYTFLGQNVAMVSQILYMAIHMGSTKYAITILDISYLQIIKDINKDNKLYGRYSKYNLLTDSDYLYLVSLFELYKLIIERLPIKYNDTPMLYKHD